jgi:hypothetical protein
MAEYPKIDEIIQLKNQIFSYHFPQNIEIVWDLLKDTNKLYELLKDVRTKAIFKKGSTSYEVCSQFDITWNNYRRLFSTVDSVKESDHHKQLIFNVSEEPLLHQYQFIYDLYKVTLSDSTALRWKFIYEGENGIKIPSTQLNQLKEEREQMMIRILDYLNNQKSSQIESVSLKCNIKYLWKIITNWNLLIKLFPKMFDECIYEENFKLEKEYTFKVIWDKTKNLVSTMKILNVGLNVNNNCYEYHLSSFSSTNLIPDQEMHFKIFRISSNHCLLQYEHIFIDKVSKQYIEMVRSSKRVFLNKLKKNMKRMYEIEKSEKIVLKKNIK